MNQSEIREHISRNLQEASWSPAEVRVQPAPSGEGWRIAVVSPGFRERTQEERRNVALSGLSSIRIDWLDLLTPEETEWAGALPRDSDLTELPLWAEALARAGRGTSPIVFPSDLEEDLEPPIVVTFYSLRGGVGRSTALAYTARILAAKGLSVICVDMDLEAPGLASLFGKEEEIRQDQGLVQLLLALDEGADPDLTKHLLRVSETEELYCLPAGVPDADYARRLNLIEPSAWYREERNPLRELLRKLSTGLPFRPDVLLLDSRTGINQLSGPLLFDLADLAVITFFPHPQARTGTAALVRALLSATTRRGQAGRVLTPEPRFLISPVPASRAPEVVRKYQLRSIEWIRDWLSEAMNGRGNGALVEEELAHFIPYREAVATSDQVLEDHEIWRDYIPVAEWIERFLPTVGEEKVPATVSELKSQILGEMRFPTGTAEQQQHFSATFVETDAVRKARSPRITLVLGRKGTGKTALFRRLVEDSSIRSVVVAAPSQVGHQSWLLHADGFQSVAGILQAKGLEWRQFWMAYICIATYYSWLARGLCPPEPKEPLRDVVGEMPRSELDVVGMLDKLLSVTSPGLYVSDWLTRLDEAAEGEVNLLFDGLDTGFGSSPVDKERRQVATEGLMAFLTDRGDSLRNLRLKVMLREDIWRKLRFENKSHLFGRSVSLAWNDKTDYFKVVIKQALQSEGFCRVLDSTSWGAGLSIKDLGNWAGADVQRAWVILVGERMQGGKTTFTRNWVWNRLADGNDDHSPRYLLQLFHQATEWEKAEQRKNPYERTVIRPRALIEVLPTVSERALSALQDEEFPELEPLLEKLTSIGRTPVDAKDLEGLEDLAELAREVGLLGIYEVTGDNVERYKVPEIYRYALSMGRRGQA